MASKTLPTSEMYVKSFSPVTAEVCVHELPFDYAECMGSLGYTPRPPILPSYCNILLDASALYGATSMAAMFGWEFARSREFWNAGIALTDEQRGSGTLQKRRTKIIGTDFGAPALEYSKRMNIIDEYIVQDFKVPLLPEVRSVLLVADVLVLQQCMLHMPLEHMEQWLEAFLEDRTRPKRMVYDCNPAYDTRDISPKALLKDVAGYEFTEDYHPYRRRNPLELALNDKVQGDLLYECQYVVDFHVLP